MGADLASGPGSAGHQRRRSECRQNHYAQDQPDGSRSAKVQTHKQMHMRILAGRQTNF
jgi:hypothetical protein